jgi:hypothetical protein
MKLYPHFALASLVITLTLALSLSGCVTMDQLAAQASGEDETSRGLREALTIGTGNAVANVSQEDGYNRNPIIRILLPEQVKKVEKVLRFVGYGQKVDDFELSMNRAAERAAPRAKEMFWDAIKQIRFEDAWNILKGRRDEATLYLKDKTYARLQNVFKPIVHQAMSEVGVTEYYQQLDSKVRAIPFADKIVTFDLDEYVTNNALDGLFYMLAEEEAKIREDPVARVTELLRKVFSDS